ncbi:uncharacterized protein SCHCODRAFT_02645521 [Schizophyllum commune H4-8]|uniref:uncharacterized protein n=1 Tax=Schizophyllum commune (strain H4-8 / FGSC 9210) TaxID=578458 RepID=UPI00215F3429|nr:uncharacterized protein SCHCODRAFT_02645521 [Schizophyllum commune H4-8]KAI5884814.1 hypothetical protein SCHCODRAFT_02645521 [Schizophyllum commune H4-8]
MPSRGRMYPRWSPCIRAGPHAPAWDHLHSSLTAPNPRSSSLTPTCRTSSASHRTSTTPHLTTSASRLTSSAPLRTSSAPLRIP